MNLPVSPDCTKTFKELKLHKYNYVIYKVTDDNPQIVIDCTSQSGNWDDFKENLPETTPRYAVYQFEYDSDSGVNKKTGFIFWCPNAAKTKVKMIYGSARETFRRSLDGVDVDLQFADLAELDYDYVIGKVMAA